MRDPVKEWETLGHIDPYFAVITQDSFRRENLDDASLGWLFESGCRQVDALLTTIRRSLVPDFTPRRALEFGCGVGRLLVPLARECEHVIGVDVSESMLREAQQNCDRYGVSNVKLIRTHGKLAGIAGPFDLITSYIVLQHVPIRDGREILRGLCGLLKEGGVGVLHLTFRHGAAGLRAFIHWLQKNVPLVHNLVNVYRGRKWSYPHMQMNRYDLNKIFQTLYQAGCEDLLVQFTDHGGHFGVVLIFRQGRKPKE